MKLLKHHIPIVEILHKWSTRVFLLCWATCFGVKVLEMSISWRLFGIRLVRKEITLTKVKSQQGVCPLKLTDVSTPDALCSHSKYKYTQSSVSTDSTCEDGKYSINHCCIGSEHGQTVLVLFFFKQYMATYIHSICSVLGPTSELGMTWSVWGWCIPGPFSIGCLRISGLWCVWVVEPVLCGSQWCLPEFLLFYVTAAYRKHCLYSRSWLKKQQHVSHNSVSTSFASFVYSSMDIQ